MKKILFILSICFVLTNAYQYEVYDLNGKKRNSFSGELDKNSFAKILRESHGSILIKKSSTISHNLTANLSQNKLTLTSQIGSTIKLSQDSLNQNKWIEIEKNETVKTCLDSHVLAWETSLNSLIYNDSCLIFQAPALIGTDTLKVLFSENSESYVINLAIGMKYLNFQNEEILLGYGAQDAFGTATITTEEGSFSDRNEDPERLTLITSSYLVDKYPTTNCEIIQLMWDSISTNQSNNNIINKWISRKKASIRNEKCPVNDSATSIITLFQAMEYANARSKKDGLIPYYIFSPTQINQTQILSKGQYIISFLGFTSHTNSHIHVNINQNSNGYRLPFYDEWMMFARGGDKKKNGPWRESTTAETVAKQAQFLSQTNDYNNYHKTGPVGQLLPNGYGLYDMFGLVEEHVLFENNNPFSYLENNYSKQSPSCFKGGNIHDYWKYINYGYISPNYYSVNTGGFRLIRKIK